MPDVPTAVEAKHPQLAVDGLIGLFGIRGMPEDLKNRIAADIKEAASDPEIAAKINATGADRAAGRTGRVRQGDRRRRSR